MAVSQQSSGSIWNMARHMKGNAVLIEVETWYVRGKNLMGTVVTNFQLNF